MNEDVVWGVLFLILIVGGMAWGALHLLLLVLIAIRLAWGWLRNRKKR